jgi:tetraacyldisaccharide 4'-kinase
MIEWLITHLKDAAKVGVLSRGYGRKTSGYVKASSEHTAEDIGDEPLQIHTKFPEIPLAVNEDRREGISKLSKNHDIDLMLLDDAHQHRWVKPKLAILLTAYNNLFTDDWYLPTGTLRDGKKEARRAHIIIVTKCPINLSQQEQDRIRNKINPRDYQSVLFCHFEYNTMLKGHQIIPLETLKNKKVSLVTGVANPEPLVQFLTEEGITFEHLRFKDHHYFTDKELETFNAKPFILTTEKDFMRSQGRINNLYYLEVSHKFIGSGSQKLQDAIGQL